MDAAVTALITLFRLLTGLLRRKKDDDDDDPTSTPTIGIRG